jgi:4-diphosphocytidyl-2-C-methyl-D-erythritol kinase
MRNNLITVKAPAKLNLTLEVLGNRPDGFHEIRSVIQAIDLCDSLHLKAEKEITLTCDMPEWSAEKSLVSRVVRLVQETTGCSSGVTLGIAKNIPLMSGLGGDSSDAAATLRALNELWELGLSQERLLGLATRLGSDVAFFIHGCTALVEGRGEVITFLPSLSHMWVVLVVPDVAREPGKTGRMYAQLKASHYTDGKITENLADTLHKGSEFRPSMLFNTFENVAFDHFAGLKVYKEHLIKLGAPYVHLVGSGPTLFTMFHEKAQAEDLYTRCKQQGMEVYMVETA